MAIIQEKGLVRAIKDAYRHGGYNVLNLDGDVVIYAEGWCVRCPWNKLPRKALATIVEHLGMIPENGEADGPDDFQLPIFLTERDRVKQREGYGTTPWSLRSVDASYTDGFCLVYANGSANYSDADISWAVAPGFDI